MDVRNIKQFGINANLVIQCDTSLTTLKRMYKVWDCPTKTEDTTKNNIVNNNFFDFNAWFQLTTEEMIIEYALVWI